MSTKDNKTITPDQLIRAYMLGMFPMSESRKNKNLFFVDPEFRAVIPIFNFHISKSLLRLVKKKPFKITINRGNKNKRSSILPRKLIKRFIPNIGIIISMNKDIKEDFY